MPFFLCWRSKKKSTASKNSESKAKKDSKRQKFTSMETKHSSVTSNNDNDNNNNTSKSSTAGTIRNSKIATNSLGAEEETKISGSSGAKFATNNKLSNSVVINPSFKRASSPNPMHLTRQQQQDEVLSRAIDITLDEERTVVVSSQTTGRQATVGGEDLTTGRRASLVGARRQSFRPKYNLFPPPPPSVATNAAAAAASSGMGGGGEGSDSDSDDSGSGAGTDTEDWDEDEDEILEDGLEDSFFDFKPEAPKAPPKSTFDILCKVPFFAQFNDEQRQQLFDALVEVTFMDGDMIVEQNAVGDRFFVIVEGEALVSKVHADGTEEDITHIYGGDYFGELSLIYGNKRVANVRSVGVSKCMYLTKTLFDSFEEMRLFLILQKVPLLSDLGKESQLAILRKLKPVDFLVGDYVIRQGELGDAFYMITKGAAVVVEGSADETGEVGTGDNKLEKNKESSNSYSRNEMPRPPSGIQLLGSEKVITHLYEGHSFGEMALLTDAARIASVRAVEPLTCMRLEANDFAQLLGAEEIANLLGKDYDKVVTTRQKRTAVQHERRGKNYERNRALSRASIVTHGSSHNSLVLEQRKLNKHTTSTGEKVINGLVLMQELGRGTYGVVRMCRKEDTGELRAIKILDKARFKSHKVGKGGRGVESKHAGGNLEDMQREVDIMKKLQHPNIVMLLEVVDDPDADQLYLVQEYCAKGAIMGDVVHHEPFSEAKARTYFRMLLAGVDYLHYNNVIHRDIKPMNLLLTDDDTLKISDFGAARVLLSQGDQMVGVAGTPAFMAPELLSRDTALYSGTAVDLWSCGATLYMMVVGEPPWMADDEIALAQKVRKDELVFPAHSKLDPHLKRLINNLLVKEPNSRMDLASTMSHSWVTEEGTVELERYSAFAMNRKASTVRLSLTKEEEEDALAAVSGGSVAVGGKDAITLPNLGPDFQATAPKYQTKQQLSPRAATRLGEQQGLSGTGPPHVSLDSVVDVDVVLMSDDDDDNNMQQMNSPRHGDTSTRASARQSKGRTGAGLVHEMPAPNPPGTRGDADLRRSRAPTIEIDLGDNIHTVEDADYVSDDDEYDDHEHEEEERGGEQSPLNNRTRHALSDRTLDIGRTRKSSKATSFFHRDTPVVQPDNVLGDVVMELTSDDYDDDEEEEEEYDDFDDDGIDEEDHEATNWDCSDELGLSAELEGRNKRKPSGTADVGVNEINSSNSGGVDVGDDDDDAAAQLMMQRDRSLSTSPLPDTVVGPVRASSGTHVPWASLHIGMADNQGVRATMEDKITILPNLHGDTAFVGVYDGHGGDVVSEYLQESLHTYMAERSTFESNLPLAVRRGCHAFDRQILFNTALATLENQQKVSQGTRQRGLLRTKGDSKTTDKASKHVQCLRAGSTAVFAFVRNAPTPEDAGQRELTVGWVGDSRAVMARKSGVAERLSEDHKASRQDETKRIRSCSGTVDRKGRLYGDLAVSRAFGNLQHKGRDISVLVKGGPVCAGETSDDESQADGPLVATPDTTVTIIGPHDEFAVLATDGVWDVINDQDAVNFVRKQLYVHGDAQKAAKNLVAKAFKCGSVDNMSCVVIGF